MNNIQQKFIIIALLLSLGTLYKDSVSAIEKEKLNFMEDPSQIFQSTVSQELQCSRIDWYTIDGKLRFECQRTNERIEIHAYGSTDYDVNGDGIQDLIIGMEFPQRSQTAWTGDDHDILLIYTTENEGTFKRMFRHELTPGKDGGIIHLTRNELTGDAFPEIVCIEMELGVSAKRDYITNRLAVVHGRPPFILLGEFTIREGINLEGTLIRQADILFQDRDGDGLQEMILTWSEGPDTFSLNPVSSAPDIYHATFTLTSVVLKALQQVGLPEDTLQALHPLVEQKFLGKQTFVQAVAQRIGSAAVAQYGDVIVQSAIGPYQLQPTE